MLIKFTIRSEIVLDTEEYTHSPVKAIRNFVFRQYLYKIVNFGGEASGICIKIQDIEAISNVIIRKTADLKVNLNITLVILRLITNQYYEGVVTGSDQNGVEVSFIGGLLSGIIDFSNLHPETIYNQQKNVWIYSPSSGNKGYTWNIGQKARFKICQTLFSYQHSEQQIPIKSLIKLRANQGGLGPSNWWI